MSPNNTSTVDESNEDQQVLLAQKEFETFLNKELGDNSDSGVVDTIPTGIDVLDAILGGGVGLGTVTVIVGNPGTFKSSICGQILGNAQLKYGPKTLCSYADSEVAMTVNRLYDLGVRNPPIKPRTRITIEKIFKLIELSSTFKEKMRQSDKSKKAKSDEPDEILPSIIVWDSIANTPTDKEIEDPEIRPEQVTGLRARILSSMLPRYVDRLRDNKISLIAVNQLRDKIDMGRFSKANDLRWMGDKNMPGGNAIKFNAFHLICLKAVGDLDQKKYGFSGVKVRAVCIKNKLFTPNIPVDILISFSTGISNFFTNYELMNSCGRISGAAWQYLVSMPEVKWNGTSKALEKYNENEEFRKAWDENVTETIRTEIIEKYKNNSMDDEELEKLMYDDIDGETEDDDS